MSPYSLSSIVLVLIQKPRAVLSSYYDVIDNHLAIKSLNCLYSSQTSLMKHTRFSLFTEFTSSFYKLPCFYWLFAFMKSREDFQHLLFSFSLRGGPGFITSTTKTHSGSRYIKYLWGKPVNQSWGEHECSNLNTFKVNVQWNHKLAFSLSLIDCYCI